MTYRLPTIRPLQTDRQTNKQQIMPKTSYSIVVARQK